MHRRLTRTIAATAVAAGAVVVAAAPAHAARYSVSVQGQKQCAANLDYGIKLKRAQGYTVTRVQYCYHSGGGYWSAHFSYDRPPSVPV